MDFRLDLKGRFAALGIVVLLILGALLVRLWAMQVLEGASFASQADQNRIREVVTDAPRGRIFDSKGRLLVTNRASLAVTAERRTLKDTAMLSRLAALLDMPVADVKTAIEDPRLEPLRPRIVKLDASRTIIGYLAEHETEFPGVSIDSVSVRQYPQGRMAAHIVGYTGQISEKRLKQESTGDYRLGDTIGLTGAEAQFEKVLRGDRGFKRYEVDASGKAHKLIASREPIPGRDVVLTIDIDVQRVTEAALADALTEAHRQHYVKAKAGAAVALDLKTGEILGMASAPSYDPSIFLGGISQKQWALLTSKSSEYPLNNRAIMSAYPSASTFKVVTGLAGLRYGVATAGSWYRCDGKWIAMGEQWSKWCWLHSGHGSISFTQGIEDSCDTVFYEIGYSFYKRKKEELQAFAHDFGLGEKTGVDLPGEVSGRVPDAAWKKAFNKNYPEYQRWLPGDTVNMAIGQGDLLTSPLQMATVYGAIGNGGAVVQPHVLRSVLDAQGKTVLSGSRAVTHKIPSTQAQLNVMRDALVAVTTQGTGRAAFKGFGPTVAGKTGTAQVAGKDDYAWFCAFAPAEKPRYAIAVLVEQGGHGGSIAGPAGREILSKLLDQPIEHVRAVDQSR